MDVDSKDDPPQSSTQGDETGPDTVEFIPDDGDANPDQRQNSSGNTRLPDTDEFGDTQTLGETLDTDWSLASDTDELPPRVLVVDDEQHILKAVRRLFVGHSCELLTAEDGEQARDILRQEPVAVLISDQRMPGISGVELLDFARRHYPKTVRVMLTGNNDVATAIEAINEGEVFRFVTKPWERQEFLRIVDMALDQYELKVSKERYEEHIEAQNQQLRQLNTELRSLNEELETRVEQRTRQVRERKREIGRLYSELQDSFDGMIKALLSIMELGEIHIVEHCQRTAERVREFGEHLQLDDDVIRRLERAALLHWIGLINASRSLFEKPIEQFDTVEMATWEFHPLLGQQAIRHIPALNQAGRIIVHYLRRWDDPEFRPGQPSSDEGGEALTEEFIRSCQMLAICSFFEQVRTARKSAGAGGADWLEEGLQSIEDRSAARFDPELVDEFLDLMRRQLDTGGDTEKVVQFSELQPGMVLSRPLETAQGIPVAPRDIVITDELIARLKRFRDSNGLDEIHVWA